MIISSSSRATYDDLVPPAYRYRNDDDEHAAAGMKKRGQTGGRIVTAPTRNTSWQISKKTTSTTTSTTTTTSPTTSTVRTNCLSRSSTIATFSCLPVSTSRRSTTVHYHAALPNQHHQQVGYEISTYYYRRTKDHDRLLSPSGFLGRSQPWSGQWSHHHRRQQQVFVIRGAADAMVCECHKRRTRSASSSVKCLNYEYCTVPDYR